jgi:hypothetical protein
MALAGVRPDFPADTVILSAAKNLAETARFFAAIRMTAWHACHDIWPHTMNGCLLADVGRRDIIE